jgi:3-hydroxy-9,10-secoandrosta-1,3,5(10)-triene-9,17-dione monooxygenase reductase component
MDDNGVRKVGDDPFAVPVDQRDPARRFRGRLPAAVTVWTASFADGRATGITVSSLLVAEGEPPAVLGLIGTLTNFWDAVRESKRFVVHVLSEDQRRVADEFAGRYTQVNFTEGWSAADESEWGPTLRAVTTRAYCGLGGFMESGYFLLVRGDVDHFDIDDPAPAPLVHYRGGYSGIRARPRD